MAMDRSKYRNPDMPVGYVKKNSELRYKEGVEIDGFHYIWAHYLYDVCINEDEDCATLSDLILSDDELVADSEEDILEDVKTNESSKISPGEIKKVQIATIVQETGEHVRAKRKFPKHEKNDELYDIPPKKMKKLATATVVQERTEYEREKKKICKCKKNDELCETQPNKMKQMENTNVMQEASEYGRAKRKICHDNSDASLPHLDISFEKSKKKSMKFHERDYKSDCRPSSSRYGGSPLKCEADSSSSRKYLSSRHRHQNPSNDKHMKIVTHSSSPPEQHVDVKIEEQLEQPEHIFGLYPCDVCGIKMNSLLVYNAHINGKRHRKNMKSKNTAEAVAWSLPASIISEDGSKYPKPPAGVIRKKVRKLAEIQRVIEKMVKKPCPGLNFVTEIQGIDRTQYYCSICDAVCSPNSILPHLTGYKHRLKSVKKFDPEAYKSMKDEPKFKIEKKILSILHEIQSKQGFGRMTVETEELASDYKVPSYNKSQPSTSWNYSRQPSTSRENFRKRPGMSFHELYDKSTIPNMSASDYFCQVCQSHMNSVIMWEAHIRGKRHLTNLKKMPGDLPSKTKTVPVPNKRAHLMDRLKKEYPDEPFVGLNEVCETEILENHSHSYKCFLCRSSHTSIDIIEHLISLKHRFKYLEHIDFPGRKVTNGMGEVVAYNLIREMCAEVESQEGSGMPAVHIDKSSLVYC